MICNTDAFFSIGKAHMVCEDYALAGVTEHGFHYAIVSDGCSSSPHTDVGARLLSSAMAHRVEDLCTKKYETDRVMHDTISQAGMASFAAKIPRLALDTTLIVAYETEFMGKKGVAVSMRGDGVVISRSRDGSYGIQTIDHENNAPKYLNYDLDAVRLEGYRKTFGEKSQVRLFEHAGDTLHAWTETEEFEGHFADVFYPADQYDLVMVASDGLHTFQESVDNGTSRLLKDIPMENVVEQLLKIKGTKGEFLKRRCHKFLTRHCVTHNWQHYDDFSAAAIWMENPNVD